jgi:hypothetical protein
VPQDVYRNRANDSVQDFQQQETQVISDKYSSAKRPTTAAY